MNTLRRDFIAVLHDVRHQWVVRIDKDGQIVWHYGVDRALDVQLLKTGGCLINAPTEIVETDTEQNVVWRYSIGTDELISARRLVNGNTIIGDINSRSIYEITRDFEKVWEMPFPHEEQETYHYLFRMIRPLSNGNLLVAWHEKSKIAEFTKSGEVVWEFPLEEGPYEGLEMPNGNYLVSVGPAGSIVEISKKDGIVWEYRTEEEETLQKGWIAGICPQPNGNIVFSDFRWDKVIEVSREKEIVGVFHDPDTLFHPASLIVL